MCLKEKINRNSESGEIHGLISQEKKGRESGGKQKAFQAPALPPLKAVQHLPPIFTEWKTKKYPCNPAPYNIVAESVWGNRQGESVISQNSSCCFQIVSHTQLYPSNSFVELGGYNENHHWLTSLDEE